MHYSSTSNASLVPPSSSEHSVMVDHAKLTTDRVPAQGSTSPPRSADFDVNSTGEDSARATMNRPPQPQHEQVRCDELSPRKRTMTLDMDSAHQCNSKQARNQQSVSGPVAEPPLSPVDVCDRKRTKLEEKRRRNRTAQAKSRQRKLDLISRLQKKVGVLQEKVDVLEEEADAHKKENTTLKSDMNILRDYAYCFFQWWKTHMINWLSNM
ncbi:hypothetical protein MTO96_026146 [Rhipicephalus appendiculatus]